MERDDVGHTGKKKKRTTVHGVTAESKQQKQQKGKRGGGWELERVTRRKRKPMTKPMMWVDDTKCDA